MTARARRFPFPRYGLVQLQILILMSAYKAYPAKLELARHAKHPSQPCTDSFSQISNAKLSSKGRVEGFVANRCSGRSIEGRLKVGLVSETQDALILHGKIS